MLHDFLYIVFKPLEQFWFQDICVANNVVQTSMKFSACIIRWRYTWNQICTESKAHCIITISMSKVHDSKSVYLNTQNKFFVLCLKYRELFLHFLLRAQQWRCKQQRTTSQCSLQSQYSQISLSWTLPFKLGSNHYFPLNRSTKFS